jgi:hypothetical protein
MRPLRPEKLQQIGVELRGVLRQLAELPAVRLNEAPQMAMKALIDPPAQAPGRRPGPRSQGNGPEQRKFTPRRPEHRGRSNSGR